MRDVLQGHLRIFHDDKCWGLPPGTASLGWFWHMCFWRTSGLDVPLVWYLFVLFWVSQQAFSSSMYSSNKLDWLLNICLGIPLSLLAVKNIQEMCVHEAAHLEEAVRERGLSAGRSQKTVPALLVCRFRGWALTQGAEVENGLIQTARKAESKF